MDVQLYPKERRLIVDGRYDLENKTALRPIAEIHLREGDRRRRMAKARGQRRAPRRDDRRFGYRIYRFDQPAGARSTQRQPELRSRIWHRGFRARTPATDIIENGTFMNNCASRR